MVIVVESWTSVRSIQTLNKPERMTSDGWNAPQAFKAFTRWVELRLMRVIYQLNGKRAV